MGRFALRDPERGAAACATVSIGRREFPVCGMGARLGFCSAPQEMTRKYLNARRKS
jgi:hypothetical protein